jgi:predicted transcriptional regulator of viral defense system
MRIDAAIQRRAARRWGIVTRDELLRMGLSPDQIKRRLRAGLLIRLHPGVYAVPGAPASFEQRVAAACLAAGEGAAVPHRSAARLWDLRGAASPRVEVTVPGTSVPRLDGVVPHRSRTLGPVDVRIHRGITITRPERTLIDVAGVLAPDSAAAMFESASTWG